MTDKSLVQVFSLSNNSPYCLYAAYYIHHVLLGLAILIPFAPKSKNDIIILGRPGKKRA